MSGHPSQPALYSLLLTAEVAADFVTRHFCKKKFHTSDLFTRAVIANEQTLTTSNSNITSDDTYATIIPFGSDVGPFLT